MNKNVRVIYKRLEEFENKGYINLNQRVVNTDNDLVEIASLFRDLRYETLRVFYIKDNKIAGYESLTTGKTDQIALTKDKISKAIYFGKLKNRMERLNADSYFIVHNLPSGDATFSGPDVLTTIDYIKNVKGYRGHFIIGDTTYSSCLLEKEDSITIENNAPLNEKLIKNMNNKLKKKSIYDIKIDSRDAFVSLVAAIQSSKDFSTAILTSAKGEVRMILDIPNQMFNMKKKELNGYFKNLARMNGVTRVFLATKDNEVFKKGMEHFKYGTFKDLICYKDDVDEESIYVYQQSNYANQFELFDERKIALASNEDDYEYTTKDTPYLVNGFDGEFFKNIPEKLPEANKNQLRILYKKVGLPPDVKIIKDTLEAKQELVKGLIEIVPYKEDSLIICNEEGKLINMPPNVVLDYDYIAGDFFLVGDDYENSGFKSLSKEQIKRLTNELSSISLRYKKNKEDEREI